MADQDTVVSLDRFRLEREEQEVERNPDLQLAIYITMSENTCTVQLQPADESAVDMDDRETIRRVCQALNTTLHHLVAKHRFRTLKPQRQRLRRKP